MRYLSPPQAQRNFVYVNTPKTQRTPELCLKLSPKGSEGVKRKGGDKELRSRIMNKDEAELKNVWLESTKAAKRTGQPTKLTFVKVASSGEEDSTLAKDAYAVREEAINTPFCPLQEKFNTFVLRGLRNISEAP